MTQTPDESEEPTEGGSAASDPGTSRKLDEDAAWRAIVENYGDRAQIEDDGPTNAQPWVEEPPADEPPADEPPVGRPDPARPPVQDRDERLRGLFRPAWPEAHETEATWDDEGHFVPPTPPPPPQPEPRRRIAWAGLFGAPTIMLVAVVLGWAPPNWLTAGLAAAFVGGFVYLVATMPERRPGEGPGGGDGAVV